LAGVLRFATRLIANGIRTLRLAGRGLDRLSRKRDLWLVIPLGTEPGERSRAAFGASRDASLSILDLLRCLDRASRDPRLAGVLLRFQGMGPHSFAHAAALRRAVDALREADVPVAAWAESLTAPQLWIASGANRLWIPESGAVQLVGLRSEQVFLKDLLDKLDVVPEVVHVGKYKSAGEMATRRSMSVEQREQLEAWQADLFSELVAAIARGRGLEEERVRDLIDNGPYSAASAREAGLIDGFLYRDEIEEELRPLKVASGPDRDVCGLDIHGYLGRVVHDPGWHPVLRSLPHVAYVVATGQVHRGPGRRGIGSKVTSDLLERVRDDDRVRAVVLRVDSPGGDAVASDLLYRAVELTRKEKPVVVSMGDVAASGGYYLAAAADAILIEAGSVTGSIGVVGGKINLEGLYRRLGIGRDAVESSARAGAFSESRGFTPDERAAVKGEMEALYDVFLRRVAEGRKMDLDEVERVAQGRIWSGRQALDVGLVDALGGPLEAMAEAASRAGIGDGERYLLDVHPRRPRLPDLRTLLAGAEARLGIRL
jgi:protease-4